MRQTISGISKARKRQRLTDVNLLYDILILRVALFVEAEQGDGSL
jgi:hypothetical protein